MNIYLVIEWFGWYTLESVDFYYVKANSKEEAKEKYIKSDYCDYPDCVKVYELNSNNNKTIFYIGSIN